MQNPGIDHLSGPTLFSRERRRQRMLQFLEMFERRSWRGETEQPYLLPFAKTELPEADLPATERTAS